MNRLSFVNTKEIKVDKMSTCGGGRNLVSKKIHNYFSVNNKLKT